MLMTFRLFISLICLVILPAMTAYAQSVPTDNGYSNAIVANEDPFDYDPQASTEPRGTAFIVLKKALGGLEDMLENIFRSFKDPATMLLTLMITGTVIIFAVSMTLGKYIPILDMIKFIVMVMFVKHAIINWDFFYYWIYKPVMGLMIGVPSLIVSSASNIEMVRGETPLASIFMATDRVVGEVMAQGQSMISTKSFFPTLGEVGLYVYGLGLKIIFFVLQVLITYVFVLAFVGIHFLMAALPFVLALSVFPKTRRYLSNVVNAMVMFLITPAMSTLALVLVMHFVGGIDSDMFEESIEGQDTSALTNSLHVMLMGLISIFFVLKSTSLAAMVAGSADAGFGQAYGAAIGLGAGAIKLAKDQAGRFGKGAGMGAIGGSNPAGGGVSGGVGYGAGKAINYGSGKLYQGAKAASSSLVNRGGGE